MSRVMNPFNVEPSTGGTMRMDHDVKVNVKSIAVYDMDSILLHLLLNRGTVTVEEGREAIRKATGASVTDEAFEEMRREINRRLLAFDIEIRRMDFPVFDGKRHVALVNTERDDFVIKDVMKRLPSGKQEYFKKLMEVMLQSEEQGGVGCLSEADARRIGRGTGFDSTLRLSPQQCTSALDALLTGRWIMQHPQIAGHYALGVRALMEFREEIMVEMELPESTRVMLEPFI